MKRPASASAPVTSLARYSKMKGASKLVSAKPVKKDTDSEVGRVLEEALDSIFCFGGGDVSEMASPVKAAQKSSPLPLKRPSPAKNVEESAKKRPKNDEVMPPAVTARQKELKAMSKDELQELVLSKDLDTGKKDEMIDTLLQHEARRREDVRKRETQAKNVMAMKKAELEESSNLELKGECGKKGLKQGGSKADKVKLLLAQWKAEGGVDEALSVLGRIERRNQLEVMDKRSLYQLCDKRRVDALVKEVMVDRLLSYEIAKGF